MQKRRVICPQRMRHLERPFGWMPVRILTEGRWGALSHEAKAVYTFLCVVSDREGMSCYSPGRISQLARMRQEDVRRARPFPRSCDVMSEPCDFWGGTAMSTGTTICRRWW